MKTLTGCLALTLVVVFMGCAGSSQYMQPVTAIQGPRIDRLGHL